MDLPAAACRKTGADTADRGLAIADRPLGADQLAEAAAVAEGFGQIDMIEDFVEGVETAFFGTDAACVTALFVKLRNRLENVLFGTEVGLEKMFGIGGVDIQIVEFGLVCLGNRRGQCGFAGSAFAADDRNNHWGPPPQIWSLLIG